MKRNALPVGLLSLLALLTSAACEEETAPPAAPVAMAPPPAPPPAAAPPPHVSKTAPKAPVALEEYFKTVRVRGLSFSADEKLVATMSDRGGRPDLWVEPVGGGPAKQITHVEGFIHSFAFSPTRDVLAYEADKGGDELPHLFLTNSRGDAPKDVVADLPAGRRTSFVEWAPDGKTLLYVANGRDEKQMDLYEYDLARGSSALLWKSEGAFELRSVSHDHRRFVVSENKSDANNDLYLVERAKPAEKKLLTQHAGDALYDASFAHDGRSLLLTTDDKGEYRVLYALDLASGKRTPLHDESWDVEWAADSNSGRWRFVTVNADGTPQMAITDVKTGKALALPAPPAGRTWDGIDYTRSGAFVLGFSKSERYLGVVARGDTAPAVPYVVDLKAGTAMPVADTLPPALADHKMVTATAVKIPAADGKTIPALLYAPEGAAAGAGPFPAVIDVHGGPTGQSRRDFSTIRQYLVSKGYVVLVPNVRGSTGYGKTWTKLNNHDIGGGPLRDVVACKHWLVDQAHVASDEVAVMGGSYGGYMALAAATFAPDEFGANVDFFGVSDLKTLVESFPAYWAASSAEIYVKFGDPKNPADAAYQHDQSPIHFMDRVKRPLLVVQGDKDARVKKDQSDRMVDGLRAMHVPVHYLVLENEGHGFTKVENTLKAYALTDRFLDHYLLGDDSVAVQ
ncbi:MAG TPA: S9 family peptidase [Polyangiaceae bacterium]|jgi:dipeptidyl aminopeptidase/acylaminoacyl peptidase